MTAAAAGVSTQTPPATSAAEMGQSARGRVCLRRGTTRVRMASTGARRAQPGTRSDCSSTARPTPSRAACFETPRTVPEVVLVAPHTRPGKRLQMVGEVDTFTIHFEPTGLHRLFGLPLQGLADQALAAPDALGAAVLRLRDRLARAPDFEARVGCATAWLSERLASARPADGLDAWLARGALGAGWPGVGVLDAGQVASWARELGWSERHLHRRFVERTGLPPSLHGRLLRFQALMQAHARAPAAPLTQLALDAGYFDQSHCIRDCRAFTGQPPRAFLAAWPDLGQP